MEEKIDNRKTRRLIHEGYLDLAKVILSKNIPKDRRYERLQIANRLWKKLEARYIKKKVDDII